MAVDEKVQLGSVRSKKVLVLVLSLDKEPYRSIEVQGQRTTWASQALPNVPVFFYYGVTTGPAYWVLGMVSRALHNANQERLRCLLLRRIGVGYSLRTRERGDRIQVRVPDIYGTIGAKTVGALRHVLSAHRFDYLYRTNTSSYVHLPLLHHFVQSVPATGYYAGSLVHTQGLTCASGSGFLLSRDLVEFAARDARWDWDLVDDLALGRSMARAGVAPQALPRIDVSTPDQVSHVASALWRNCFHVRCKSVGDRLGDIETMQRVHAAYARNLQEQTLRQGIRAH
jgi:hypothetical protein